MAFSLIAGAALYGGGATLGVAALGGLAAATYNQSTKSKGGPAITAPQAPPQASKAPTAASVLKAQQGMGQAGGAPGVAQTFLTGSGGIDPSLLQLGKSTLLGG